MKYDICVFGGCALDQFYYKNKKTIILVAPCLNSSQIGFINILIKSFKNKKFVLIINKNKIIDRNRQIQCS